jgi:hypothetical protein
MYMHPNGMPVGYEGMSGWLDDLWGTAKQTVGGFLKGGVPGAITTITGQPVSVPIQTPQDAWTVLRDTVVTKVAQTPQVQPILKREAMKTVTPYLYMAAAAVAFVLLTQPRRRR